MKFIYRLSVFSFFTLMIFAAASPAQTFDGKTLNILTGAKITGAWRINYAESDNPILKMQTMLQNKLATTATEKTGSTDEKTFPKMSISIVPPETLILAGEDEKSITINENFSEIVLTRTFATDGKNRVGELQGANFMLTATQKANLLRVETISPRGNKMTEIYALESAGRKLVVTVRFETAQGSEIMTLRRVYDRALLDVLSGDNAPAN